MTLEARRVTPPSPFSLTLEARRLEPPAPFDLTLEARRLETPPPFGLTLEARRLETPPPFGLTLEARRLEPPAPFDLTLEAGRLDPPAPFDLTLEAGRLDPPAPFGLTLEARRLDPPAPFALTLEAIRDKSCDEAQGQLTAATALKDSGKLGAAEERLAAIDPEQCPDLPAKIEAEQREISGLVDGLLAEADAAAAGCGASELAGTLTRLTDSDHPRLGEARSRLARIAPAAASAEAMYKQAQGQYLAGELDQAIATLKNAESALQGAGAGAICQALSRRIAAGRAKAERLLAALDRISATIAACDASAMQGYGNNIKALANPHPLLAAKGAELDRIAPRVAGASQAYEAAKDAYVQGELGRARSKLAEAQQQLAALGGEPECSDLKRRIAAGLNKIAKLEAALRDADAAIAACKMSDIDAVLMRFRASPAHVLIRNKTGDLERAKSRCAQGRTANADAACRKQSGPGYRVGRFLPDGRFYCVPDQETANRWCRDNNRGTGWYAVNIRDDGGFDCRQTQAGANAWCAASNASGWLATAVRQDGKYDCYPGDAARTAQCERDNRARGWRAGPVRRQGDRFVWDCYPPPTTAGGGQPAGGGACPPGQTRMDNGSCLDLGSIFGPIGDAAKGLSGGGATPRSCGFARDCTIKPTDPRWCSQAEWARWNAFLACKRSMR